MLLPLAVPLAVCEACEELAPVRCLIKWPNDIWLDERKLAGILIEARPPEWAVIGVGVNVAIADEEFPDDLRWPAVSLGRGAAPRKLRRSCARRSAAGSGHPTRCWTEFRRRDALARPRDQLGRAPAKGRGGADGVDEAGT